MPTPSYSHQIVFNPLWLTLNSRGHHVTLFTTDPIKNANLSNFRQIDWSFAYQLWHEKHNVSDIIRNFNTNLLKCLNQYVEMMNDIIIQELEHPQVQEIINDKNEHFDLVVVEFLNPAMVAFSKRFNCPFIGMSPMDLTNFVHEALGNPISPALFPDFISRYDGEMNFFERVLNTFYYVGSKLYFKYYFYPKIDEIIKEYFGEDVPPLEQMQRNASMVFLNTNPIIHNIRPLMSNVLMVGGGTHFEGDTPLPEDIQKFLDGAENGAIYFSLGTNVKSKDLDQDTKTTFLQVFSELPYKVLWKFEDAKHPKIKLFITQGGLQSLEEAIYNGIPIIGMPVYVDQYSNVKRAIRKGMGIILDSNNVGKEILKKSIEDILNNEKYKKSAEKLSILLKEQPVSGLNQTVKWIEYVLKYKGAKFLKPAQIPTYQYLLIDVLTFFVALFIFSAYFSFVCLKLLVKCMKERRRVKTTKLE
ncbi:2-hydroxyacylsphingosine 1-beta-galactosyltransferase-like Protein [Tribolium castaneum]|uniref:2-hydroxyacylsphingosine 1-beta-galactosyltransferase-like Protein n=1 Tax=Tribolium castaneum TaxID=7070 RepID=D6WFX0_TRICA|nr:2-hydroxyacylsphingosine 1-beta-galactosyltransferase-like Protein [Tribolium castaneum]